MTDCSCGTCECQNTIMKLETQQLENTRTITSLEMQIEKLQKKNHMFPENSPQEEKKNHMFPESFPQEEEECVACSA